MKTPLQNCHGFALRDLVFWGVSAVAILFMFSLAVPRVSVGPPSNPKIAALTQAINNARQVHLATMSMANDGEQNRDSSLGWPGDLKAAGKIGGLGDFANTLVRGDYLKAADLKVFAAVGIKPYPGGGLDATGQLLPAFQNENSAFKVYLVKASDPPNTVFMATRNFTYGKPLDTKAAPLPFGAHQFVVIRKSGDASYFHEKQVRRFDLIGPLPGGGTVESAENCLNP